MNILILGEHYKTAMHHYPLFILLFLRTSIICEMKQYVS